MSKTYFIDIDGTIVQHLTYGQLDDPNIHDTLLPGVIELWNSFDDEDIIIITTARLQKHEEFTKKIFEQYHLRYNKMLFDLNSGPRILINDTPDISFPKAIAMNVRRNDGFFFDKNASLKDY
jgi:uncharacterized HAD superfamily protein